MFEWVGKISDYTATWRLKKEANWRIKSGQSISLTDSKKDFAEEAREKKPQTVGTLRSRMRRGSPSSRRKRAAARNSRPRSFAS